MLTSCLLYTAVGYEMSKRLVSTERKDDEAKLTSWKTNEDEPTERPRNSALPLNMHAKYIQYVHTYTRTYVYGLQIRPTCLIDSYMSSYILICFANGSNYALLFKQDELRSMTGLVSQSHRSHTAVPDAVRTYMPDT